MSECNHDIQQVHGGRGSNGLAYSTLQDKYQVQMWYHRIFFHFLDIAIVNSWLLYRKTVKSLIQVKRSLESSTIQGGDCSMFLSSTEDRGQKKRETKRITSADEYRSEEKEAKCSSSSCAGKKKR